VEMEVGARRLSPDLSGVDEGVSLATGSLDDPERALAAPRLLHAPSCHKRPKLHRRSRFAQQRLATCLTSP
jgi:hypothetical protein